MLDLNELKSNACREPTPNIADVESVDLLP